MFVVKGWILLVLMVSGWFEVQGSKFEVLVTEPACPAVADRSAKFRVRHLIYALPV
jgi:hypothetical protein